mmetsp:Transcript_11855/g.20051  ORF Transcript_11855/g.20051 Transcript_11855/m.20051 type:complete len:92 (-) Transcript_11855:17-292(-)
MDYVPVLQQRQNGEVIVFCEKCNIIVEPGIEHCRECQVCIEGHDHHCVFYSKCIGSGNLFSFWATIVMLLFNFVLIGVFTLRDGVIEDFLN